MPGLRHYFSTTAKIRCVSATTTQCRTTHLRGWMQMANYAANIQSDQPSHDYDCIYDGPTYVSTEISMFQQCASSDTNYPPGPVLAKKRNMLSWRPLEPPVMQRQSEWLCQIHYIITPSLCVFGVAQAAGAAPWYSMTAPILFRQREARNLIAPSTIISSVGYCNTVTCMQQPHKMRRALKVSSWLQ